jgi:hypothetical protein
MEQIADSLNWLCSRWLDRRNYRRTRRDALNRHSFTGTYHQQRNFAATCSRLSRFNQNRGAL